MSSKSCARLKIISSYCWSSCSVKPTIAQTPSFGQRSVYCVIPQYIQALPPPQYIFLAFSLLHYYYAVYYLFHFTNVLIK